MEQYKVIHYPSANKKNEIFARVYAAQHKKRGVLQIVHGIGEHAGRYDEFAQFMAAAGFTVVVSDHLGHGKSIANKEELGYIGGENGWKYLVDDVHALSRRIKKEDLPLILMGHSMGSFVVRTSIIEYPSEADAVILSGTGQQSGFMIAASLFVAGIEKRRLGEKGISKLMYNLSLGSYNKKFKPNRTTADWLSRDHETVNDYIDDLLCGTMPTVNLFEQMLRGLKFIGNVENMKKMDLSRPVLFVSGNEDPVGGMGKEVRKVFNMFSDVGVQDVMIKLYEGGRHEMLKEINREEVMGDILNWIEVHVLGEG